jgi:hypothetical protein
MQSVICTLALNFWKKIQMRTRRTELLPPSGLAKKVVDYAMHEGGTCRKEYLLIHHLHV